MKIASLYIVLFITIIFPFDSKCQTPEIDSLESLLLANRVRDSNRVNLLNAAAAALQNIVPEKAFKHLMEAGELAQELKYKKGEADYYNQLAAYYYVTSNFDKVLEYANKSLVINDSIGNKQGVAKNYHDLGNIFYFQGNVDKAIAYLHQALDISIALKDSASICKIYASLGTDYSDIGNYELALKYEETALEIAYKINDKKSISTALNNLGVVSDLMGNWPRALECYQQSLKIDEQIKDFRGASIAASNIAYILNLKGNYRDALDYCEKGLYYAEIIGFKTGLCYNYEYMTHIYMAQGLYDMAWESQQKTLSLQKEIGNKQGLVNAYRDLADLLVLQGKLDEAMEYYIKAVEMSKIISYKRTEIGSYIGISTIYIKLNNAKEAYRYSKKAYSMAFEIDNIDLISRSAEILAKSSKSLGFFKEAYEAQVTFKTMSDSLFNEENIRKISNLEYEYKAEKESERLRLEQQKKDHNQAIELKKQKIFRNYLIVGFLFMILLAVIILRGFLQKRKANMELHSMNLAINKQSEQLKNTNNELLQLSQFKEDMSNMVIHDLKNPLSTLLHIDVFSEKDNRDDLIKHLANKMLNMIENILDVYKYETTELDLNKENLDLITIINGSIKEVEFLANMNRLKFSLHIKNKTEVHSDAMVLRRIFSNILSNAVKFSSKNDVITIKSDVTKNGILKVYIHNNGSFITAEQQKHIFTKFGQIKTSATRNIHSTGLGLTYCEIAIKSHGGNIGVESTKEYGTTFWFTLPEAKIIGV